MSPIPRTLIGRLFYYSAQTPLQHAVITPNLTLTYSDLLSLVEIQACRLAEMGVDEDSVVGIRCVDDVRHLVLCLATAKLEATSCTISSHDSEQAQGNFIKHIGITHVLDDSIAIEPIAHQESVIEKPKWNETEGALIFATSGTTGQPKSVVHRDSDIVAQAHRHVTTSQERFLCLASIEHNFSKRHRLYTVAVGATNVFVNTSALALNDQCLALGVTSLHVSAFQAQQLLAQPGVAGLRNIRLKLGGSHVPYSLREQLRQQVTPSLYAGYGTTETGAIAFSDPADADAGESVGYPLPGIEVRVLSPSGEPVDIGSRGELTVRCKGMFRGYLGQDSLTSKKLVNGWFHTGDTGYIDAIGRIWLCGRIDDMFVFNSVNIYPQDIESELRKHATVEDAVVLPKTSETHGSIPVALVVFSSGTEPDIRALKLAMRTQLGLRCPRQLVAVESIPRNAAGKIKRAESQALFLAKTTK